jgi:hypothetical protein
MQPPGLGRRTSPRSCTACSCCTLGYRRQAQQVYELVAVCIGLSIVAYSSTGVPVAWLFDVEDIAGLPALKEKAVTDRR